MSNSVTALCATMCSEMYELNCAVPHIPVFWLIEFSTGVLVVNTNACAKHIYICTYLCLHIYMYICNICTYV